MRDPYSILGVSRSADLSEIKAAWRAAAKQLHPDQNPGDPQAVNRFTEVGRAYDLLKDPEKRRRFDEMNARSRAEARGAREATFMERRAESARREAEARARAEAEARAAAAAAANAADGETEGDAEEVVAKIFGTRKGAEESAKTSQQQQQQQRAAWQGDDRGGAQPSWRQGEPRTSPALEMLSYLVRRLTRQVPPPDKAPDLAIDATVSIEDMINRVSPTVTLPDGKLLSVTLPEGAIEGTTVRLEGYGHRLPGMRRGDVVATIRIARHPWYRVDHYDIHTFLDIDVENAVLGCEMMVETPDGPFRVTVPEWSGSNHRIRVEGRGLPRGDCSRGDLHAELRVMLWDHPDQKVIDLMRSLREGLFL